MVKQGLTLKKLTYYGHLLAEAMALAKGGEMVVLQREYDSVGVIYEDKDQVVYLR